MKINPIPDLTKKEIIRLLEKFDIGDYNECWLWKGAKTKYGHGRVGIRKKTYQAYRVVFRIFKYASNTNLVLDHRVCSNPSCVNPHHLREVTNAENVMRSNVSYCAVKAKATHCPKGHPLSGDNLWIRKKKNRKPSRECLECHRARKRIANMTQEQIARRRFLVKQRNKPCNLTRDQRDAINKRKREKRKQNQDAAF